MNEEVPNKPGSIDRESINTSLSPNPVSTAPWPFSKRFKVLFHVIGVFALSIFVYELVTHYSIVDDAYISFRFLDNWLAGHGLVYNPGERVEGYSNLLFIILLAPLRYAGLTVESAAITISVISIACLLWAVFQTARNLTGEIIAGWIAVILAAGSIQLTRWAVSGMETVLFAALIALANHQLSKRKRHDLLSSAFFGLSTMTRPPGVLFGAIAFATTMFRPGTKLRTGWRNLIIPALFFLLFPFLQLIFRLYYYGLPLPNTAYVKLGGELTSILRFGYYYFISFLTSGGIVLYLSSLLIFLLPQIRRNWIILTLFLQILVHTAYIIYVGGDFFEFSRFFVPIIPCMAILGGIAIFEVFTRYLQNKAQWMMPITASFLMLSTLLLGIYSSEQNDFEQKASRRENAEKVATWIDQTFPENATIAINVAGLIPYRTQRYTIDMLGLNDRHIAQSEATTTPDEGLVFVGHFKHDGDYVCSRKPDIVVTGGSEPAFGRTFLEASIQPSLTYFPGDREFLRSPECKDLYQPTGAQISPGVFAVVYTKKPSTSSGGQQEPKSAKEWFEKGLRLMNDATMEQAAVAFERSLELSPGHSVTMTNLGYCYLRLGRFNDAKDTFNKVLGSNPTYYNALYGLAMAHTKLDNRSRAIATWKRYIAEAPGSGWKREAKKELEKLLQNSL